MLIEHVAVGLQAAEHVDLVQQRRVLDDQRVGRARSARATRIGRSSMRQNDDDGRAGALGAEARERLRVAALDERRDREQLGRGDDALAAAAVDAHLEHRARLPPAGVRPSGGYAVLGCGELLMVTPRSARSALRITATSIPSCRSAPATGGR